MRILLTGLLSTALLMACQPQPQKNSVINQTKFNTIAVSSISLANAKANFSAHWLTPKLIAIPSTQFQQLKLMKLPMTSMQANTINLEYVDIEKVSFPTSLKNKYPHLADFAVYQVNLAEQEIKQWLKHRIAVTHTAAKDIQTVQHVQTSYVIDALYTPAENDANEVSDLGATISDNTTTFKLWSPTAFNVAVKVFSKQKKLIETLTLEEDQHSGIWHVQTDKNLDGLYYQYQLSNYHPKTQKIETFTTTDPYSLSLSTNSKYSQIVSLNNQSTQPDGWLTQQDPTIKNKEDAIFYELHIRDFSAGEKRLAKEENRGKYGAFSEANSYGINHLKNLKNAGLTHLHLLPAFDIGTVNENSQEVLALTDTLEKVCQQVPDASICNKDYSPKLTLSDLLKRFDPLTTEAQQIVSELRQHDNYNWGYDPFHYTVPEGSYAINPEGKSRIIEFREMVQNIHNMGFRVIMDVVYNHTHQAGLAPTAVLDKIVPNYYHRLNKITGDIEQSTCCDNTATERVMMEKLMIDSLVVWARDYKIDGFRFDLMAHQPKSSMLKARKAVQAVDSDTYFYGEGWNFGEVANNQQFIQASQLELAGSEIGTFSDRLRDAIRGPGISVSGNDIRRNQGLGNGLGTINNELQHEAGAPDYQLLLNHARIGLAGNLANYPLTLKSGETALGKDIMYGNQPTGYALDPADTINYVSKHDNQTLWDNNQYRNDNALTTEERVRLHIQSLSYVMLGQGIPFIHMGSELLRSKSYLRDSYDYADWFNYVDFSKQNTNYHVGLPPADKDKENWPIIRQIIRQNEGRDLAKAKDIELASAMFNDLLKIRTSTDLFRLTSEQEVINQLSFLNVGPRQKQGLIVMKLTKAGTSQSSFNEIIVIFNANKTTAAFDYSNAEQFALHPVLQKSVDAVSAKSKSQANKFIVPPLTTTVFVK